LNNEIMICYGLETVHSCHGLFKLPYNFEVYANKFLTSGSNLPQCKVAFLIRREKGCSARKRGQRCRTIDLTERAWLG